MKILMFRGIDTAWDNGFRDEDETPYYVFCEKILWRSPSMDLYMTKREDAIDHERFDYAEVDTGVGFKNFPLFESVFGGFEHYKYPEGCEVKTASRREIIKLLEKYSA